MPSFSARVTSFILRKTGLIKRQFAGGLDFGKYQAKALAAPSEPAAKLRNQIAVTQTEFQGRPVWELSPRLKEPTATILYWHGGGYVYPPAAAHWAFLGTMALKYGWRVVAPLYPLAPNHDVGVVTDFALALYKDFLLRQQGASFVMAGDSAGAGLTSVVAMAARGAGLALPQKLILISPWLDAHPSHVDQAAIEPRDAILTLRGIREAGAMYAAEAGVRDPRVSPIFGDWAGLPPILAFGGGDDILVTDARALKAKLPEIDYLELDGMIHDWPIFTFPESRAAQAQMANFSL
jgi:epsilon-lactone hydrolase